MALDRSPELRLALQPFCSAEWNHLSNFGRGSLKEHLCEIILKSGHWPRRCLKFFFLSIFSFGSHFVQWSSHFNNFGRGSPKEYFCVIILK